MSEPMSYDLNPEMIGILVKEFDVQAVVDKFDEGLKAGKNAEECAQQVFGAYGKSWAKRTLELGEKYSDQTYENIKAIAKQVKSVIFPHIPQRFVEIGYLATQPMEILTVQQNNHAAFVFTVPECSMFNALKEKCGEGIAKTMPCKRSCMAFNETVYKDLNIEVNIEQTATIPADGFCRFAATNAKPE